MTATRMLLRSHLRAGWRGWAALALLLGLVGGIVLLTGAGARRTDTAYARFLADSGAADVLVSPQQTGLTGYYAALRQLPQVQGLSAVVGISAIPENTQAEILADGSVDGRFLTAIERPKLLEGRMPSPEQPWEVLAGRGAATGFHLHAGSRLHVLVGPSTPTGMDMTKARHVTLTVVGVVATRDDVVTVNANAEVPKVLTTPAFVRQFDPSFYDFDGAFIRLRPGTSIARFQATAEAVSARFPDAGSPIFVADEHEQAASVERAIRPQAVALGLFSVLLGLATLVVVGQLAARQIAVVGTDLPALRALGMTPRQLVLFSLAEVSLTAVVGAVVAMVVGILGSPFMPIGPARIAEPHPGIRLLAT